MRVREVALTAVLTLAALPAAAAARTVAADPFTLATPPLAPGQVELLTLSTLPQMVTGGDALMAVRGLDPRDRLRVLAGRRDVTAAFAPAGPGERRGLVTGLSEGRNVVAAVVRGPAGRRVARLAVVDHPVSGPVISGPHQEPFACQTEESGLGPPLDADCSIRTAFDWFYRSHRDGHFHPLRDPYAPYPDDAAFVVRVETATINRGITRIVVRDDPAERGPDRPFAPTSWNGRITHAFGQNCGPGHRQGASPLATIFDDETYGLPERLAAGDVVVHSTMTTYGVYCNPLVSAETAAMVKEHVAETYGLPEREVGVGGSGGALQQYNAANNFPGLLDGATPIASFADLPSVAMTVLDCGVLVHYWSGTGLRWSDAQRAAVAGHRTPQICRDWVERHLHVFAGELADAIRNVVGADPATGRAYRPYDNTGVQYGLAAFNSRQIDFGQFADLNRRAGGFDADGSWHAARDVLPADAAERLYRIGMVVGRGSLARIPIIDLATYFDVAPGDDIHDDVRPFQARARLLRWAGTTDTQQIWRGFSLPAHAQPALTVWMDAIDRAGGRGHPGAVGHARPRAADDRCIVSPAGLSLAERQSASGGNCQAAFTAFGDPRMAAGGPLSDDVVKCALKPVDPRDYRARLNEAQLAVLRAVFPDGVCDWSRPGVGELPRSLSWPSVGATTLQAPRSLAWNVARSR